jgi:hypothetical protein
MLYSPMAHFPRRRRRSYARAPVAMGAGGVVVLGLGAFVGVWAASSLHRWSSTLAVDAKVPAGFTDVATYNSLSVDAPVSWKSVGWQVGLTTMSFIAGGLLKPTWAKLLFYGMGVGSATHVSMQLVTKYILLPLFAPKAGDTTGAGWGPRAYMHELQSKSAFSATGVPAPGSLAGPPARQGSPPIRALPAQQPMRVPASLAAQPARARSPQGTLAAPPPGNLVPNMANGNCPPGSRTVVNPDNLDMPWCVGPDAPPATPTPPPLTPPPILIPLHMRPATPPPATSNVPPPPAFTSPPAPPPMPTAPPMGYGQPSPCGPVPADLTAAPCCGNAPCSCGGCQGQAGQPPDASPSHPFFRNMLAQQSQRRRAA